MDKKFPDPNAAHIKEHKQDVESVMLVKEDPRPDPSILTLSLGNIELPSNAVIINNTFNREPPPPVEQVPICTNCTHIARSVSGDCEKYKCFAPQNHSGINIINGEKVYKYPTCVQARSAIDGCTYRAQWFVARPPEPQLTSHSQTPGELDPFEKKDLANIRKAAEERVAALKAKRGTGGSSQLKATDLDNL